jgi:hypothetical protein
MRIQFAFFPFIGVMALFLVSCAGSDTLPRQQNETPSYGAYPYGGSNVDRQQYGPQDRAGNQMQNGLPAYSNCQYTTRC